MKFSLARSLVRSRKNLSSARAGLMAAVLVLVGVSFTVYSHADTQPPTLKTQTSAAATAGFVHPGILESQDQLDLVKAKIAAGAAPQAVAFTRLKSSRFANTGYVTGPVAMIDCDANVAGCTAEHDDAIAAYTQALLWAYTGNRANAQAAIRTLNAWSATMVSSNGNQAHLNHAWAFEVFPRAAEIIRYTYTPAAGETAFDVTAFTRMLNNVVLPQIADNTPQSNNSNGNWDLSMTEAVMNIAVFTDNRTLFDTAVARWRARVPSYIYLTSDGANPVTPPGGVYNSAAKLKCFWLAASSITATCPVPANYAYLNGQSQETCRDLGHVLLGFEAMTNGAETARIQGVDLYNEQKTRIMAGYEFESKYHMMYDSGQAIPATLCGGNTIVDPGGAGMMLGWEIAYNHYVGRLGESMPNTLTAINRSRPSLASLHMDWETLTHGGTSVAGETPIPSVTPTLPPSLVGDFNADGKANVYDLSILLGKWATNTAGCDLNHDGTVSVYDLSILLSHWTG